MTLCSVNDNKSVFQGSPHKPLYGGTTPKRQEKSQYTIQDSPSHNNSFLSRRDINSNMSSPVKANLGTREGSYSPLSARGCFKRKLDKSPNKDIRTCILKKIKELDYLILSYKSPKAFELSKSEATSAVNCLEFLQDYMHERNDEVNFSQLI